MLGTMQNEEHVNKVPTSIATHTRTIGIIYPPPNIRNVIETTAQYVAKSGPEFEKTIVLKEARNTKFGFLKASDPYNAYYQHRLAEANVQKQPENSANKEAEVTKPDDPSAQLRPVINVIDPPEVEQYTVRFPEGITSEEVNIIKLTAQFVARNGKSFLTGLTSREINNPLFYFLNHNAHSNAFMFFTSIVDVYSKVLMPSKNLTDELRKSVIDMTTVMERCLHRLEWEKSQEMAGQKAEDEIEQERLLMSMIDWHDFVVVETIDFPNDEDQDLPPPMNLEEVIRGSKMSTIMEQEEYVEPVEMDMDDEEMQLVEEGNVRAETLAIQDERDPPMRIVKNWKRPEERMQVEGDPTEYVVSPINGELLPTNEMSEHMRISLIDPKNKEQKERMFAKIRETTLAQDDEISRNIVGLAQTRPDIFGTTEEEVSNAVKAESEKKKEEPKQVSWDGNTGSIGRTASQAMSQNSYSDDQTDAANDASNLPGPQAPPTAKHGLTSLRPLPLPLGLVLNIPKPLNTLHYSTPTSGGVAALPPPRPPIVNMIPTPPGSQFLPLGAPRSFVPLPMPPPGMPMVPPPPMSQEMPPPPPAEEAPLLEEPESKRQKPDEYVLNPEEQFLTQHSGLDGILHISVPNTNEGNLKRQVLEITVESLSETIGSLKEKICGEIQLPANKQKLSGKAGFLKDNLSLAYYNVAFGDTLTLSLRERGGRKR